ncbi:MAG: hypothetical protein JWQ19_2220 [Subtercola sp.]|nr:hypothetical protein [Subtercola sp.]
MYDESAVSPGLKAVTMESKTSWLQAMSTGVAAALVGDEVGDVIGVDVGVGVTVTVTVGAGVDADVPDEHPVSAAIDRPTTVVAAEILKTRVVRVENIMNAPPRRTHSDSTRARTRL